MYRVIKTFRDAETRELYRAGDVYPRSGTADEKRLETLLTAKNRRGVPLIERVDESEERPKRARRKAESEE